MYANHCIWDSAISYWQEFPVLGISKKNIYSWKQIYIEELKFFNNLFLPNEQRKYFAYSSNPLQMTCFKKHLLHLFVKHALHNGFLCEVLSFTFRAHVLVII